MQEHFLSHSFQAWPQCRVFGGGEIPPLPTTVLYFTLSSFFFIVLSTNWDNEFMNQSSWQQIIFCSLLLTRGYRAELFQHKWDVRHCIFRSSVWSMATCHNNINKNSINKLNHCSAVLYFSCDPELLDWK